MELFGAGRLMYGGDWLVCVLAGGYERVWLGITHLLDELLDEPARAEVLGGTAARFYRLGV